MKEKEIEWVDVHDDALMVELGIHYPNVVVPDFCKTPKEHKLLKKVKHSCKDCGRIYGQIVEKHYPLEDKIIIYLKKNDNYPHTVYSRKIWQYQIPGILRKFVTKKGKNIVDHYVWNGKTYDYYELPINPYNV